MKYSRQRELIRQAVMEHPVHPDGGRRLRDGGASGSRTSASAPSTATSTSLPSRGELLKICLPGASDRFDARTDAHHHLLCDRCGRLYDIELGDLGGLEARIRGITDFTVTGYQVYITGICQNCAEKH